MTNNSARQNDLDRQVAEFEQQHPKVAQAMELFGMTMVQYEGALQAMSQPRIFTSSSTIPQEPPRG